MSFRRIANQTPLVAAAELFEDRFGREVLTTIAKMTWLVDANGDVRRPKSPAPIRVLDEPSGSAGTKSLRYPSDYAPEKPGTDLVLIGTAYPPPEREVTKMHVSLRVETGRRSIEKPLLVHGPRHFYKGLRAVVPGPAGPLRPTPLVYERTYGGVDRSDPKHPMTEPRNPIGVGFSRDPRTLVGTAAPSIEDPGRPMGSSSPAPAGLGPIPSHWEPRAGFAGTRDEAWLRCRAPVSPIDFDPRFHCFAPPGLWSEEPLWGDEAIEAVGVTPEGVWRFRLPRYRPVFFCKMRGSTPGEPLPSHLDTLLIDADARRVEMTYRATFRAPRKLDTVERVTIMADGDWQLLETLAVVDDRT